MNVHIAASVDGRIAAIGPRAVHGARHDTHAFEASDLKDSMHGIFAIGDLGYAGAEGIDIVPIKRASKCEVRPSDKQFNSSIATIRALNEQAVAHFKSWRMMSEEGGRYRAPIEKFEETLQTIIGLVFFRAFALSLQEHPSPVDRQVIGHRDFRCGIGTVPNLDQNPISAADQA